MARVEVTYGCLAVTKGGLMMVLWRKREREGDWCKGQLAGEGVRREVGGFLR